MATSLAAVQISSVGIAAPRPDVQRSVLVKPPSVSFPSKANFGGGLRLAHLHPVASSPKEIQEKVSESIKNAEETCASDEQSGECVAAWDEVEELSAAASHARVKEKESSDPLENYCKDNPETDECRTYED